MDRDADAARAPTARDVIPCIFGPPGSRMKVLFGAIDQIIRRNKRAA